MYVRSIIFFISAPISNEKFRSATAPLVDIIHFGFSCIGGQHIVSAI